MANPAQLAQSGEVGLSDTVRPVIFNTRSALSVMPAGVRLRNRGRAVTLSIDAATCPLAPSLHLTPRWSYADGSVKAPLDHGDRREGLE